MTITINDVALRNVSELEGRRMKANDVKHRKEALFHCCEIVLGKLLGTGAFCEVHELEDVRLLNVKELPGCIHSKCRIIDEENERRKREHLRLACHDAKGKLRYVVKHLRPDLAADRGMKVFSRAAVDCLRELNILSRLCHKNVVRVRGSALSGRNVINKSDNSNKDFMKIASQNDPKAFFIVLERVEETLSQRIRQWRLSEKPKAIDSSISDADTMLPLFYPDKLRFGLHIASAIDHVHSHGMIFR